MRICSCTLRVCNKNGPCDVQNAVEKANLNRIRKNKAPLTTSPADVQKAVNMFYADHKKETGQVPCRGCEPLVHKEATDILAGQPCEGAGARREASHAAA